MKGLTFQGPQDVRVEDVDEPSIVEPTDALVRVTMAGICGSDLHIFNAGAAFGFPEGSRLGHEFIGTVEEVGAEVAGTSSPVTGCCRRAPSRAASAPGAARASRPRACAGRCSAGRRGCGSTAAPCRAASPSSSACPSPTRRSSPMPEALRDADREASLLPLVDVMSTGWHGLTSAGAAAGQSVVVIGDGAVGLAGVHGARAKGAERIVGPRPPRRPPRHGDRARRHAHDRLARRRGDHAAGDGAHRRRGRPRGRRLHLRPRARWRRPTRRCARVAPSPAWVWTTSWGHTPTINWCDQFLRNISVTGGLVPGPRYIPELLDLVAGGHARPGADAQPPPAR